MRSGEQWIRRSAAYVNLSKKCVSRRSKTHLRLFAKELIVYPRDMPERILLYDTTLRDGAQSEDIQFSTADKLRIVEHLDQLGVDYIEGGWPGANAVDTAFFEQIKTSSLRHAKLAAFGSTHHASSLPENDKTLLAIAASGATVGTIFGKSCSRHARIALGIPKERNLEIIRNSVAFLKSRLPEVFFDAEHFFDGYLNDSEYALAALRAALDGGADALALCDTNGGNMPDTVAAVVRDVRLRFPTALVGIHAHNDCELAVGNTLAAIEAGARHVQGTVNGIGERCGNANLCSVIPNILLKSEGRYTCMQEGRLPLLKQTSAFVADIANMAPFHRQPFVGDSAFAHKGGVHVSAINKSASLYEHIDPADVGNARRVLMTEQGGKSNILALAKNLGYDIGKDDPILAELSEAIKDKSTLGYDYAAAEASVELLLLHHLPQRPLPEFFTLQRLFVVSTKTVSDPEQIVEATLKLDVRGQLAHTAAGGQGPVHALDKALRKGLAPFYPEIEDMRLTDYKVRVLSVKGAPDADGGGTASYVRVLIESSDARSTWTTVGVSYDIINASWQALSESVIYHLYRRYRGM